MKYRNKHVEVEAMQFHENCAEGWPLGVYKDGESPTGFAIDSIAGVQLVVSDGDWIVINENGEISVFSQGVFKLNHEPLQEQGRARRRIKEKFDNLEFRRYYFLYGYPEKKKILFWRVFDTLRSDYIEFGSRGEIGHVAFKWYPDYKGRFKWDRTESEMIQDMQGTFTFSSIGFSGINICSSRLRKIADFLDALNSIGDIENIHTYTDINQVIFPYLEPMENIPVNDPSGRLTSNDTSSPPDIKIVRATQYEGKTNNYNE
jgi:hypothetical protein